MTGPVRSGAIVLAMLAGVGFAHAASTKLSLTDAQKQALIQVVRQKGTDVGSVEAKKAKLKDFTPAIGTKTPPHLTLNVFPHDAITKVPKIQPYGYVKLEDKVLIVDPMSKKIAAIVPY